MKRRQVLWAGAALALPAAAQDDAALAGRWEGEAELPGLSVPVVLDLAPFAGGWVGAATLPGRGPRGAALAGLAREGATVRARLPGDAGIAFELVLAADGAMLAGRLLQAGHAATLRLRRTGPPQLDPPPPSVPWPAVLDGVWRGRYDIGFGPREVTLSLAAAGSTMTIVGRRRTELAFDEQRVLGVFLRLRAAEFDIAIEAPLPVAGRLEAHFRQGPFEAPLPLQREGAP